MTSEEAIKILNELYDTYIQCRGEEDIIEISIDSVDIEALYMAIKALEQEPTTKENLVVDCIDRAELLKAMDTWDKFGYTETGCFVRTPENDYVPYVRYGDMVKCVKRMPSVTPQEPQTFKWCTDCREYDQEKHCCHRYSKVIRDTVTEIEQEPRSEWEQDHAILKAYSDGANDVLDKIRAEIIMYECDCRLSVDEYPSCKQCTDNVFETIYGILDKYKAESEG